MGKVKKGVIAAAGRGTRFLPVVKAYPKELIPILEKPQIQYLVEEFIGAGIKEIAIVHRHGEPAIKRYFTPDPELEDYLKKTGKTAFLSSLRAIWRKVKFRFIPQGRSLPYGNASPVLAARGFIGKEPFVYAFGDDLIIEKKPGGYLKKLIDLFLKYQPAVVLAAQKVSREEIKNYGSIAYQKDPRYPHRIGAVKEKLPPEKAPSLFAQLGRFVVSSRIFSVLEKQTLSRGELWFADAVNTLAQEDIALALPTKKERWMTTGDPFRWLLVNLEMGLRKKEYQERIYQVLGSEGKSFRGSDGG